mgnify:CR=1 FL=1
MDLVINEVKENGYRLGETAYVATYRGTDQDGKKNIVNFHRTLSLTRFSNGRKFISLEQATGIQRTGKEILDLLLSRQKTVDLPKTETFLTLRTFIHEFGHIWGLCDQYPLDNNQTNCDPLHSTLSPQGHIILNEDAAMSSSGWIHELGLHDDDIEGIIDLAERSDIASTGWAMPSKNYADFPARVIPEGPVRHMKIKSANIGEGKLKIISSMDIDGGANIIIQMKFLESEAWRNQGPTFEFSENVKSKTMILQVNNNYSKPIEKLRLIYTRKIHHRMIDEEILSDAVISNEVYLQKD